MTNGNIVVNPHQLRKDAGLPAEPRQLSKDEKQSLGKSDVPLYVHKAEFPIMGEHGECWLFTCDVAGYMVKFFMSDPEASSEGENKHPEVTAEYNAIKSYTDNGVIVGPYRLRYIVWKGGDPFYKLEPASAAPELTSQLQEALPF